MAIKKYSKVKFTLRKELIIILASIVVLLVATILFNLPNEEEKFLTKWQESGAQISENHLYTEVSTLDELKGILESKSETETTLVFFATPSSESVGYFQQIITLADKCNVEKVYILDSSFVDGKTEEELETLAADFKDMNLESNLNFWAFKGTTVIESVDKYEDTTDKWNVAFAKIFVEAYKGKTE